LNVSENCLDRQLSGHRRNKAAILWEGEPGEKRTVSPNEPFIQILDPQNQLAAGRQRSFLCAPESDCVPGMQITCGRRRDSAAVNNFRFQILFFRLGSAFFQHCNLQSVISHYQWKSVSSSSISTPP